MKKYILFKSKILKNINTINLEQLYQKAITKLKSWAKLR